MKCRKWATWLPLLALLATGCVPSQLSIHVRATANTNQARPLYMVVRTVDPKAYLAQTYDEVVARVISPDESVLHTEVVYPGMTREVTVPVPQKLPVAVSFLFTSPDGAWQTLLDALVPGTVEILLEGSRILEGAMGPTTPSSEEDSEEVAPEAPAAPEAPKAPELPKAPKAPELPKLPVELPKMK